MAKIKRNPVALQIADLILDNYDPKNARDIHDALKDVFGPIFEKMVNAEMDAHLGYEKSSLEAKVLSMYARGISQRDISATIEDIYGFSLSQDKISSITDSILGDVSEWLNRPLKQLYTFMFVDCIYVKIKNEKGVVENNAVYVLLGVDAEGLKEVLGLYISPTEAFSFIIVATIKFVVIIKEFLCHLKLQGILFHSKKRLF